VKDKETLERIQEDKQQTDGEPRETADLDKEMVGRSNSRGQAANSGRAKGVRSEQPI
jgi:hypothetical protein